MAKGRVSSLQEALRQISTGLRGAALRPNIYGYEPHDKQLQFHQSQARGRQFIGGNRSGKTVSGAVEACWYALNKHPYRRTPPAPTYGRIVSVDFQHGVEKIVRPEIARWLPKSEIKGGSWESGWSSEFKTLSLENGSTIEFMSYEQELEKFAGTSRHWTWFDEEPPKDIFTECKARLIDTKGDWWISMTPVEGMTWTFDELYIASKTDPGIAVIQVDMGENPHISPDEIDAFMVGLSVDERKARVHGRYVQIGGLIYAKAFSATNVIDPIIPPKSWLHVASLDHGLNNPTCWLWGAVDRDGRIVIYDEHYESQQLVSYHASVVHVRNQEHGRAPDYYIGDPSITQRSPLSGESVQLEYVEHGIPVMLGDNNVSGGLQRVARYLLGVEDPKSLTEPKARIPRLYITRNCTNLLWELPRYRWSNWATRKTRDDKNKKEEPHKKNDHACDALRYLVSSRPQQVDDGSHVPAIILPDGANVPVSSPVDSEFGITPEDFSGVNRPEGWDPELGTDY